MLNKASLLLRNKLILAAIILAHIFILTKLIYFPYPELFIYPYLVNNGLKPYSQILDQHFPGLMFLPVNLDNLGMNTPETARLWSIAIVVIAQIMLFVIASEIFRNRNKALLVNILYLVWQPFFEGWVLWIDSFLPILILPVFYTLYKNKFFLAGLLLGLATVFKQTVIPLSLFALIYIFWQTRNLKLSLKYLLGLTLPIFSILIYFAYIGVLKDFWFWTVIFNLTIFAKEGRGMGPTLAHFTRVLLVFGSAIFVVYRIKTIEAQILLIFLAGALIGLSTRFDFVHFQPALPFALLASVYGLRWLVRLRWVMTGLYGLIAVWWLIIFYKGHLGDRVIAFDAQTMSLAAKIKNYANAGEKIFVFGGQPHLYQMSDTLPAGDVFVFQFPWFMKAAEIRILQGLEKDKPQIVISDRTVQIENRKITDFAPNIDRYILENYEKIDNVGDTEILRKK